MEDKMVRVLLRNENGSWSEIEALATNICAELMEHLTEEDEIMLVAMEGMVLWSGLGNHEPLTIEDLTGFFG